jgi:TolC family type I secretion outer membrane protein
MFVRRATALAAALLTLTAAFTARAETLMEALATTYATNPTLAAQRAQQRQLDEQVPQALSGWRPQVSILGNAGSARLETDLVRRNTTPVEYGLDVTQPLFRGGRTVAQTRAAENAVRAGRARLMNIEQDVLFNAVVAYINVLAVQAVLEFEVQNEQRLTRFLEATSDRFEVGEVTRTDVYQAEARLARASADRVQAEGDLEAARAAYIQVVGTPPTNLALPEVPADLPESMIAAAEWATEGNPQVIAAEFDERSAANTVDQVRGELLPELNLRGEATRGHDVLGLDGRTDDLRATMNVEVPLYQGGAVYSRVRQAKQAVAEQRRIVDDQRREAARLATTAWSNLVASSASVEAFRTEVKANEVAVDGVLREQAVGTRTVLDVLDTQQDLLDSQRNLVNARRDELQFAYEVKRAIGTLTAELLGLPVDYYSPEVYYRDVRNQWFGTGKIDYEAAPAQSRPSKSRP